jgi:hypothetical protein
MLFCAFYNWLKIFVFTDLQNPFAKFSACNKHIPFITIKYFWILNQEPMAAMTCLLLAPKPPLLTI